MTTTFSTANFSDDDSFRNASWKSWRSSLFDVPVWVRWTQDLYYFVFAGVCATAMNAVITVTIVNNKQFRSRFYVIVGFLSFTRTATSLQFALFCVFQMCGILQPSLLYQCRLICDILSVGFFYSVTDVLLLMFMVVDRLVAILRPSFYRLLSRRQAILVCVLIQTASFAVHVVPIFCGVDLFELVVCADGEGGVGAQMSSFCNVEPCALTALLLLLQLAAITIVWRCRKVASRTGVDQEYSLYFKRQTELMKALRNMVLTHTGLILCSRICLVFYEAFPLLSVYFSSAVAVIQVLDVFLAPIILLKCKRELRDACLPPCRWKTSDRSSANAAANRPSNLASDLAECR